MSYRILPHTSDLRIQASSSSLQELFEELMRGMFEAMRVHPTTNNRQPKTRKIQLTSTDREALLIDFLSEALYLSETNQETYDTVRFFSLGNNKLKAQLSGSKYNFIEVQIKAATYHGLKIEQKGRTYTATVVFDI